VKTLFEYAVVLLVIIAIEIHERRFWRHQRRGMR